MNIASEDIYADAARAAFHTMLREWALRKRLFRNVLAKAGDQFRLSMSKQAHGSLVSLSRHYELYAKGLIAINTFSKLINLTKDVVAAVDLKNTVSLTHGEVQDSLDALVVRNDHSRSRRSYMMLTLVDDISTFSISNKYNDLHAGFSRQAVLELLDPVLDRPIMNQFFNLSVKSEPVAKTSKMDIDSFHAVSDSLLKGIKNEIFLPTANPNKCKSCFYNKVCNVKHAGHVSNNKVSSLKNQLTKEIKNARSNMHTM